MRRLVPHPVKIEYTQAAQIVVIDSDNDEEDAPRSSQAPVSAEAASAEVLNKDNKKNPSKRKDACKKPKVTLNAAQDECLAQVYEAHKGVGFRKNRMQQVVDKLILLSDPGSSHASDLNCDTVHLLLQNMRRRELDRLKKGSVTDSVPPRYFGIA
mmetsp:Transcript_32606/g.62637  ORF Transcript_32606/g.62637 Transcript_32606/m.62637 type:complete len:155 (+) Transcript_32606:184-648(+)